MWHSYFGNVELQCVLSGHTIILWLCTITLKGIGVLSGFFECQLSVSFVVFVNAGGRGSEQLFSGNNSVEGILHDHRRTLIINIYLLTPQRQICVAAQDEACFIV